MATRIVFAAGSGTDHVSVTVTAEPEQVERSIREADGSPIGFKYAALPGEVYINPATVAYWAKYG